MQRKKPKAILFDFDGVLLDSLALHLQGWHHAVLKYVDDPSKVANYDWESLKGLNGSRISQIISEELLQPNLASELFAEKSKYIRQHFAPLFTGTEESIKKAFELTEQVAIVSNAGHEFIQRHLEHYKLDIKTVFALEHHPQPKPSPLAYINAAKKLGMSESDHASILVFEDTAHGIKAAAQAKMHAIGVCTNSEPGHLMSAGAKETVSFVEDYFK